MYEKSKSFGFTLIELVVAIAITAMLTVVTLAAFRQGNKSRAVQLGGDLVLSAIRTAQNDSLNPQVLASATCADKTATEYHVHFDLNTPTRLAVLAYDQCGDPAVTVQSVTLPASVQLKSQSLQLNGVPVGNGGNLDVKFIPPFGRITASVNGGNYGSFDLANVAVESTDGLVFHNIILSGVSGRIDIQ